MKVTKAKKAYLIKRIKFVKRPTTESVKNGAFPVTLTCFIALVKPGVWEADDVDYKYYNDISYA